jgi:hypothetical protein
MWVSQTVRSSKPPPELAYYRLQTLLLTMTAPTLTAPALMADTLMAGTLMVDTLMANTLMAHM